MRITMNQNKKLITGIGDVPAWMMKERKPKTFQRTCHTHWVSYPIGEQCPECLKGGEK